MNSLLILLAAGALPPAGVVALTACQAPREVQTRTLPVAPAPRVSDPRAVLSFQGLAGVVHNYRLGLTIRTASGETVSVEVFTLNVNGGWDARDVVATWVEDHGIRVVRNGLYDLEICGRDLPDGRTDPVRSVEVKLIRNPRTGEVPEVTARGGAGARLHDITP